jgi:hypothetical protein
LGTGPRQGLQLMALRWCDSRIQTGIVWVSYIEACTLASVRCSCRVVVRMPLPTCRLPSLQPTNLGLVRDLLLPCLCRSMCCVDQATERVLHQLCLTRACAESTTGFGMVRGVLGRRGLAFLFQLSGQTRRSGTPLLSACRVSGELRHLPDFLSCRSSPYPCL